MKVEILYPELCTLYGESANVMYLKKNLKDATFINTSINDEPRFIKEKVDLVYIGSTSEEYQELIINKLIPYKDKIKKYIDNKKVFLATGNACEIFCNYIENEDGSKIKGLGIYNGHAKRNMNKRHNSLFLGEFLDIPIVGYKSQFSFMHGPKNHPFIEVKRGVGINPEASFEGFKINNLYATYLLGPILILNPYFTKYLFNLIGYKKELMFEKEAVIAYEQRLMELKNEKVRIIRNI